MATDKLDTRSFAEQYGFAWETVKQSQDLIDLFRLAAEQEMEGPLFLAKLKNTPWWSKSSGPWKAAFKQEFTGDTTWEEFTLPNAEKAVVKAATNLGVGLNAAQKTALARLSVYSGWSEDDLTNALVRGSGADGISKADTAGITGADRGVRNFQGLTGSPADYKGQAANVYTNLKNTAENNGVDQTDAWYRSQVTKILDPNDTYTEYDSYNYLAKQAQEFYPTLADQVGVKGQNFVTVRDAAAPYIAHIARGLGIADPNTISLTDDLFRKAIIGGKDAKGGPAPMSLYDLDNAIRQDKRWAGSAEGQDVYGRFNDFLSSQFGVM